MDAQILIRCGDSWFQFSKSQTGILDYNGKLDTNALPNTKGYQELASSTYFSPSWYIFLQSAVNNNPKVYVAPDVDVSDEATFSFLIHVGALLAAVDAKDSLLAGELYLRRKESFEKFAPLTQYIIEPFCAEILFSLAFGRMQNLAPESVPLIFNIAKKKLGFDSSRETLEQAFMRYFKQNKGKVTFTLPLVGTQFYNWMDDMEPPMLEKLCDNLSADDLLGAAEKIRSARHAFYAGLETVVQAEPYNRYDKNSILVCIENPSTKLYGNAGLEKTGHIRALAAKILRESMPEKMNFGGKLASLSPNDIVVELSV